MCRFAVFVGLLACAHAATATYLPRMWAHRNVHTAGRARRAISCNYGLKGTIFAGNDTLAGATIIKTGSEGEISDVVMSRKDGTFILPAVEDEEYNITVRSFGYQPQNLTWQDLRNFTLDGCLERQLQADFNMTELTQCDDIPCANNGTCFEDENNVYCDCLEGFYGSACNSTKETAPLVNSDDDPCDGDPCMNGGTCSTHDLDYECHCVYGFKGSRCHEKDEEAVGDYCYPNPCRNDAECRNIPGEVPYECICPEGFEGPSCEITSSISFDECDDNPCMNGGECRKPSPIPGSFVCLCPIGYTGDTCNTAIDFCMPNPCNGGTCTRTPSGFICACQDGWTGPRCTNPPLVCQNQGPCENGGRCEIVSGDTLVCHCPLDYEGSFCEKVKKYNVGPCLVRNTAKSNETMYVTATLKTMDGQSMVYIPSEDGKQHVNFDWQTRAWTYYNYTLLEYHFNVPAGTYVFEASAFGYSDEKSSKFTVHVGKNDCTELALTKKSVE